MKLSDFVCFEAIVADLEAKDRDGVITELVTALDESGQLGKNNAKDIAKAIIAREKEASTGLGKGIALPHVKHPAVNEVVATVGQSGTGIDFSALDKQFVYTVVLLISPENDPDKHLQAMETVFKHLQNEKFRKFLRQSQSCDDIEDFLREADENPTL